MLGINSVEVKRPLLPALRCLHEGCPEGGPAVYTLIKCTSLLVEKAGIAPDVTLRFTTQKQVSVQVREDFWGVVFVLQSPRCSIP